MNQCVTANTGDDLLYNSLKECDVVALQVELQRSTGREEPRAGHVVAVRVDGRQVLMVVKHVGHVVLERRVLKQ